MLAPPTLTIRPLRGSMKHSARRAPPTGTTAPATMDTNTLRAWPPWAPPPQPTATPVPTCDRIQTHSNSQHKFTAPRVQQGAANLNRLWQPGDGTDVQASQWVHQACLWVDGDAENRHGDAGVRVRHGSSQLQPLTWPEASEPSVGKRLIRAGSGRIRNEGNEGNVPLPVVS